MLGVSLDENLRMIADSVAFCAAHVPEVIYDAEHFFDGYKRNPDYALQTLQAAAAAGAAWIVLCDTNGGTLPEEIAEAVAAVAKRVARPARHPHATTTASSPSPIRWPRCRQGATQVQGTINGIGERCGNVDLCSVIANLALKYRGYEVLWHRQARPPDRGLALCLRDGQHEFPARPAVRRRQRVRPQGGDARPRHPQERRQLRAHRPGHRRQRAPGAGQRAVRQVEHRREAGRVRPGAGLGAAGPGARPGAGARERRLPVRGRRGVVRPAGRAARRPAPPWFERLGYHVSVCGRTGPATVTEATVKLRVGDVVEHTVSEGDGPVNALDGALRKALEGHYPRLREMQLVDYKVRVINARAGTAARVRVVIESKDHDSVWGTVGVSENVIEASWLALVDAFDHKLSRDAGAETTASSGA